MSKFSFCVTKSCSAAKIYEEVIDKSECLQKKICDDFTLTFIFKKAAFYPFENCVLLGYAVDHDNKKVLMDPSYIQAEDHEFEGVFTAFKFLEERIKIFSDLFGMSVLAYSSEDDFFICSDSVSDVAKIRELIGYSNQINEEEVFSRAWVNSITNQVISPNTSVDNIFYRLPGQLIEIGLTGTKLKTYVSESKLLSSNVGEYREEMRLGMQEIAGLLSGLSLAGYDINCDLSGGLDSRLVLAMIRYCCEENKFIVNSNKSTHMKEDFAIAELLSYKYNFGLNPKRKNGSFFKNDPFESWFSINAGLNDSLYVQGITNYNISFKAGGFGAAIYKGGYGFRKICDIGKTRLSDKKYRNFQFFLKKGLVSAGFDSQYDLGSELHYLLYRNALHGGSIGPNTLYFLRPLNNRRLASLAFSNKNQFRAPKSNAPSMLHDLIICFDPFLAVEAYDKKGKNISESYAFSRYRYLGGVGNFIPYDIKEISFKLSPGSSKTSLRWARQKFYSGDFTHSNLQNAFDFTVNTNKIAFDSNFSEIVELAKNELNLHARSKTNKGKVALGKIFSLNLAS